MVRKSHGKHLLWEILCILLLLSLLFLTILSEISRSSDTLSFERVDLVSYTLTDTLYGYVFRDEIAVGTANNGPVAYQLSDGKAAQKGQVLAQVYRDDTGTDKRERAAELYARIAEYEAALAAAESWRASFFNAYTALMRDLGSVGHPDVLSDAAALAEVLGGRDAEKTARADAMRAEIDALRAQLAALTVHTNDPSPVKAELDGIFYHKADGLEALFGTEAANTLSPAALFELLLVPPATANTVGKLVNAGAWYLVLPTSTDNAATYQIEQSYTLHFENGTLPMQLTRIATEDTSDTALLIFRAEQMPTWLSTARKQRVSVEKQTVSGLCIPACAVTDKDTVYIARNGEAQLCPVTPLLYRNGCLLVQRSEDPSALHEGDTVIVSTRQLFPGKVLK